jgi:uncharacterized membrane protein
MKLTFLLILAISGIIISSYLIYSRKKYNRVLICPTNECNDVLDSKYSDIFSIKNDILGLVYYLIIFGEYFLLTYLMTGLLIYFKIISSTALFFSIYLLYVQVKILGKYCIYCILSAIINMFIFYIIMTL